MLLDYLDSESHDHFERVQTLLSDVGVAFSVNPRLVRGLDYYTHTVFEWVTDRLGAQSAICSGGRYDGLVSQLGGRDTPGVGWALGIERVVELMRAEGFDDGGAGPDAYAIGVGDEPRRECFAAAERLRQALPGVRVQIGPPGSFRTQLRRADRSGARYALIVGEDELAAGKFSIKPLRQDREQELVSFDELVSRLDAETAAKQ